MQLKLPFPPEPASSNLYGPLPPQGRIRRVDIAGHVIAYSLHRTRRRTIGITIDEQGLRARAPRWTTIAEVEAFIRAEGRWVVRRLAEARRRAQPPFAWEEGARLPYLGCHVRITRSAAGRTRLVGDRLEVPAIEWTAANTLRAAVISWLRAAALALGRERVAAFTPVLAVPLPEVRLSNAASQWGSCTKAGDGSARILLHWKLVHLEQRLLDYVVVHELAHLRHMNHSAAFWSCVAAAYPGHERARRELRELGHHLPNL
jgi:predicted metal-dependent hydrolase